METINMTIDELNAAISAAVNAALDARESKRRDTLVSRDSCAQRLRVSKSTLWRWASGYLVPVRIGNRVWYTEESIRQVERGERNA